MKPGVKYAIIIGLLLGFGYLFVWMSRSDGKTELTPEEKKTQEAKKKDSIAAAEKELVLRPIPINPSGTFLIHELFRSYEKTEKMYPMRSPIATHLKRKSENDLPNNYILLGDGFKLTYDDAYELIDYVEQGNNAFISCSVFPYQLEEVLFSDYSTLTASSTDMTFGFHHSVFNSCQVEHKYESFGEEVFYSTWNYWETNNLYYDFAVVSYMDKPGPYDTELYPVCLRLKIGEGFLFLHSQPFLFTNKVMMTKEGKSYAENLFSNLPKGNTYWHQIAGKFSDRYLARRPDGSEKNNREGKPDSGDYRSRRKSPLDFILNNAALRWALYLTLAGLLFYFIFQSKRRRRIVPSAEKRANSSIEFVDTVSQMYFQEKRHDKLIRHQEFLFMNYIRNKYQIHSGKVDTQFIEKLERKSGINRDQFMPILKSFAYARKNQNISNDFLIKLHTNIENFYENCN